MNDQVASLKLAVDSRQVDTGAVALGRLDAAARTAEQSASRLNIAHRNAVAANENLARASRQAGEQIRQLGFQINDIATGLATGQSPFMILAQQGGQVYQALNGPGGVSAGLRNVGSTIASLLTPARAAGVALAAAAGVAFVAWNRFENQQLALRAAVNGLGREAGITADALRRAGSTAGAAGALSQAQGVDFAAQIVKAQPQIGIANLQEAVRLSRAFAQVYADGDLQEGQKKFNDLLAGGAAAVLDFDRKFNLLNVDQRQAVRDALAANNQNAAMTTLLEALDGRTKNWRESIGKTEDAFIRIKNAISDLMTTFAPFVDNVVRLTASFAENVARGARVVTGQQAPSARVAGILDSVSSGMNSAQGGGIVPQIPLPPARPADLKAAADAQGDLATKLRESAVAQRMATAADADNVSQLEKQRASLQQVVGQLSTADPKWGDYRQALDQTTEALKNGTAEDRAAAIQSNTRINTNNAVSDSINRVRQNTEELARQNISDIGTIEKLDGIITQLNEKRRITGGLTREENETLSRSIQQRKSVTDADGARLSAEQRAAEQDDIALQNIRARTQSERAAVAVRQTIAQQRGQDISGQQALNEQIAAAARVREEDNQKIRDGLRDQQLEADMIAKERDLLFATADARARSIAMLQKEQELRRQGIPTNTPGAQALIAGAGTNAVNKLLSDNTQKQFDQIKSAGVDAFTSLATAIASGTKAMDAMIQVSKQLGSALISGGLKGAIEGLSTGNFVQAGIGGAEAAVGLGLELFGGNSEKKKQQRQKMMDDAKTQADEAARKAQEINQSIQTYLDRITAAAFAGGADSLENRLAQFDVKAQRDRMDAATKGGTAIALLEQALGMERANIVADWNKTLADQEKQAADDRARQAEQAAQEAERQAQEAQARMDAIQARARSAQDRAFAAGIDTSTFAGQAAAMERQFERERLDEIKAGGEAFTDLLMAQDAERLGLLRKNSEEWLQQQKQAFDEAKTYLDGAVRSIGSFLAGLLTGSLSPLSPQARLAATQSQYNLKLGLAQSGNRDALNDITNSASGLLEASRSYYGSSSGYQSTFAQVQSQLGGLPAQVSPEQFIVNAINTQTNALVQWLMQIDSNGDGQITRAEAANTFLANIFNTLDTDQSGTLDPTEIVAAIRNERDALSLILTSIDRDGDGQISRAEAANTYLANIFGELDTNGDGMLQKTEILTNAVRTQTSTLAGYLASIDTDGDGQISRAEAANTFLSRIFTELDTNGDGQLSKLELLNVNTGNTATHAANTAGFTASSASYDASINNLTASINNLTQYSAGQLATANSQLGTANSQLATQVTTLVKLQSITWNTARIAQADYYTAFRTSTDEKYAATGGYISGPGTETSDSVRLNASNGEFVMRAAAVRAYGRGFFDRLNSGMPIVAGGSPELLAELKALRAEVAQLRAVTAAGAEYVRDGVDAGTAVHADALRETKLVSARNR